MKKIVKAFLTAVFAVFTLFTFVACNGNKGCADDAHTWDKGALIKKATCTEKGVRKYTCTTCDEEKWEVVDALGHVTDNTFTYDANSHWYECSVCHEKVDVATHNLKVTTISEATCSVKGSEMVECDCGYYAIREIEKTAHNVVVDAAVAPTCSKTGLTEGKHCDTCGEVIVAQKVVKKLEHKPVTTVEVSKSATCEEDGIYANVTKCSECGEVLKREENLKSNKLGHKLTALHERVEPTCEKDGNIAYYECETCHKNFADKDAKNEIKEDVTLYHTGHNLKFHFGKEATCQEKGYKYYYTCSKCDYTTYEELPMVDHDMVDGICSVCGTEKEYASMEDVIKNGKNNEAFTVVGKVVAIYSGDRFNGIYIANGEYAIQLFGKGNNSYKNVKIGDIVEASGTYAFYADNRTTELNTTEIKVFANGTKNSRYHEPVAYEFDKTTFASITKSANGSDNIYTNRPITVSGVVTKTIQSNRQVNISVEGVDVPLFFKSKAAIGTDIYNFMNGLKLNDAITVSGVIGSYKGTTQIVAINMPSRTHIHTFDKKVISDKYFASIATCYSKVRYYYSCECGEKGTETFEDESTERTGHICGLITPEVSATCEKDGVIAYYQCLVCEKYLNAKNEEVDSLVIKALGHTYDESKWVSDEDNHFHKCIRCDAKSDVTPHTFDWVVDKEATEDYTGLMHEECEVCHFTRNENTTIPQLAHKHVLTHVDAKEATCLEDGNVEYYICNKCKKTFEDEEGTKEIENVVVKGDHDYGKWIDEVSPTYLADGVKGHYECSVCKKYFDADHKEITDLVFPKLAQENLDTPVVVINTKTGVATWESIENATSYEITVNGKVVAEVSETTYTLTTDGDIIKVVAKSTNEKYLDAASAEVEFIKTTGLGTKEDPYTVSDSVKLIKKFYSKSTSTSQYYVKGQTSVITSPTSSTGKYSFDMTDGANSVFAYSLDANSITMETIPGYGYDVVVLAKMTTYNGILELLSGKVIEATKKTVSLEKKSVSEFLEIGVSSTYYEITGIVSNIINTTYGNFDLVDENDSTKKVYVYGVLTASGESKKFNTLDIAVGDTLTVIGNLSTYNSSVQIKNAYFVSVTKKTEFTVTLANEVTNATITGLPTTKVTKGTKVEFTVTPKAGYKVSYVQVEGETITADATGKYSFVVNQDVEVNIVVVEDSSVDETIDLSKQGYTNAQKVTDLTSNDISIVFAKATGQNDPKYYTSGTSVRVYASNTITISVPTGYEISKIAFTTSEKPGATLTANSGTVKIEKDTSTTWEGSSQNVVITLGTKGQFRISKLVVSYKKK